MQYIVVDGKSTDLTLDIINNYRNNIDTIISESDSGIYNAMNKALKFVKGDVVFFLNSDDRFYDNRILSDIENEFNKYAPVDIVYGNVVINEKGKQTVLKFNEVNEKFFYKKTICHQALFIKRNLLEAIGGFDEKYIIHADVDWLMKAYFSQNSKLHYFDRTICFYSTDGLSSDPRFAEKYKYDRQEISAKYFLEAKIKLAIKRQLIKLGLYN
jgi:glycosyltransferase involved in cell wall biosynthesis